MTGERCPHCQADLVNTLYGACPRCLLERAAEGDWAELEFEGTFAGHEILQRLGRGGSAVVFKVRHVGLDRTAALKILSRRLAEDPGFVERFNLEARTLARLDHPNIVHVHDFGQHNGYYYIVMEYVEGVTLREQLRRGKLAPDQVLKIIPQICDALDYAHRQGVVHRDVKPENILIDPQGKVKITDFGLAKIVGPSGTQTLTRSGVLMGTPHYMAPEQVESPKNVDHRADIYSLGVVFYELLTGELPLGRFEPPSLKGSRDARLDEIIMRSLDKNPDRRYQHASEVRSEIETVLGRPGSFMMTFDEACRDESPKPPSKKPAHPVTTYCGFAFIAMSLLCTPAHMLAWHYRGALLDVTERLCMVCAVVLFGAGELERYYAKDRYLKTTTRARVVVGLSFALLVLLWAILTSPRDRQPDAEDRQGSIPNETQKNETREDPFYLLQPVQGSVPGDWASRTKFYGLSFPCASPYVKTNVEYLSALSLDDAIVDASGKSVGPFAAHDLYVAYFAPPKIFYLAVRLASPADASATVANIERRVREAKGPFADAKEIWTRHSKDIFVLVVEYDTGSGQDLEWLKSRVEKLMHP